MATTTTIDAWVRFRESYDAAILRVHPPATEVPGLAAAIRWRCPWIGKRRAARWARALSRRPELLQVRLRVMESLHRDQRRAVRR